LTVISPADAIGIGLSIALWIGNKFSAFSGKRFDTAVALCKDEPHDCSMIHTYYPKLVPVATPEPPEPVK